MEQNRFDGASTRSSLAVLFSEPRDLCRLSLALPQIWLWIMLRAIDQADVSTVVFYGAEGLALFVVLLAFRTASLERRVAPALSWVVASLMALATPLVYFGPQALGSMATLLGTVLGGVGLMGCYLEYFSLNTRNDSHRAVAYVLLSFALVPLLRLPLDLLSMGVAALLTAPLPFLFVLANRMLRNTESSTPIVHGFNVKEQLKRIVVALGVFGFAMGLFRVGAAGLHDNPVFVLSNLVLKVAFPLAVLVLVSMRGNRVGVSSLCQGVLVLLLVAMVVAVNLASVPAVPFVVFDFARYVIVVVLFLALTALRYRTAVHPYLLFAAGWAPYTIMLVVGLVATGWLGVFGSYPDSVVLDVMCVLSVTTVLATSFSARPDLQLFADGDLAADAVPAQPGDLIETRCAELAVSFSLSPREHETMELICRGRSKRYIAESMQLSENTVRGYAKTLYAKLDVHSRDELMALVETSAE